MLAFARIGLVPDGGAAALVAARAGGGQATRMALLGDRVERRRRRCAAGSSTRCCADDGFEDGALRAARPARRRTDPLLRRIQAPDQRLAVRAACERQLELEAAIQQEMAASGDFAEGVAAFLEQARSASSAAS